jgi:hypothetical protein
VAGGTGFCNRTLCFPSKYFCFVIFQHGRHKLQMKRSCLADAHASVVTCGCQRLRAAGGSEFQRLRV